MRRQRDTTTAAAAATIESPERRNESKEFAASYFDLLLDSLGLERTLTSIRRRRYIYAYEKRRTRFLFYSFLAAPFVWIFFLLHKLYFIKNSREEES